MFQRSSSDTSDCFKDTRTFLYAIFGHCKLFEIFLYLLLRTIHIQNWFGYLCMLHKKTSRQYDKSWAKAKGSKFLRLLAESWGTLPRLYCSLSFLDLPLYASFSFDGILPLVGVSKSARNFSIDRGSKSMETAMNALGQIYVVMLVSFGLQLSYFKTFL